MVKGLEHEAKDSRWILSCLQWDMLKPLSRMHYLMKEVFWRLTHSRCSKSNQGNSLISWRQREVSAFRGGVSLPVPGWQYKEWEVNQKPMKERIGRIGRNNRKYS